MRKFVDTLVLVVSSFIGVPLFVKGLTWLFVLSLALQYVAFISYAGRKRGRRIKDSFLVFNAGYLVVLSAYLLSCYLFKNLIL